MSPGRAPRIAAPDGRFLYRRSPSAHAPIVLGIEIANVGPLQRSSEDPSVLNWWPPKSKGAPEFTTKFCNLDETDRYVTAAYRTKNHFASFPAVQVDAVGALIRGLCEQFSIPATLPPIVRRFECDVTRFATYTGVCAEGAQCSSRAPGRCRIRERLVSWGSVDELDISECDVLRGLLVWRARHVNRSDNLR